MLRLLIIFLFAISFIFSTEQTSGQERQSCRVLFYNVENFFDIEDDYETEDDEFLPVGFYRWTQAKFEKKRDDIAKVVETASNNNPPVIVGLCEIENRYVLEQLTQLTSLSQYGYAILHKDSPDTRGIDVALLYLPQHFQLIDSAFFKVSSERKTREILYAKGMLNNTDTLHLFVNHWPSKRDGETETEPFRIEAAFTLRNKVDSIFHIDSSANIIVMGDFNDFVNSKPIQKGLRVKSSIDSLRSNDLYNVATLLAEKGEGTSKYRGKWQLVDMMFCSANMLNIDNTLYCNPLDFTILNADFLLEEDKTYQGLKPKRTLAGPRYIGGTSDHLPIYINIYSK